MSNVVSLPKNKTPSVMWLYMSIGSDEDRAKKEIEFNEMAAKAHPNKIVRLEIK